MKCLAASQLPKLNNTAFQNNNNQPPSHNSVETAQLKPDPIVCQLCNQSFSSRHDFYRHSNAEHREKIEKNWQRCLHCLWFFPSKKSVRDHGCRRQDDNQLESKINIKEFFDPDILEQHEGKNADSRRLSNKSDVKSTDKEIDVVSKFESEEDYCLSNERDNNCLEHLKHIDSYERPCFSNNNEPSRDAYKKELENQR